MARWLKKERFIDTDETRYVKLPSDDGKVGKVAVYVRESGAGSATLAVRGSFTSDVSSTATSVQITAATSTGSGNLTVITALSDCPFSYLHLVFDATGVSTNDVYITFL